MPTQPPLETQAGTVSIPTPQPTGSPAPDPGGDRPLLIPRILQADYGPRVTKLLVGFDIDPAFRGKPSIFGEVYDAKLSDQAGREISALSTELTEPEKATLEFAPLPAGVTELTLRAELVLHGVPAIAPLTLDLSGHPLDQAWPVKAQVRFGDLVVKLHTARLSRQEIGAPPDAKQQIILELWGENAKLNGASLSCLFLSPLPPQSEGSIGCGQEPDGISAMVSLGPAVDLNASLPMPIGQVMLQATADFLLPGVWVTTWPVQR